MHQLAEVISEGLRTIVDSGMGTLFIISISVGFVIKLVQSLSGSSSTFESKPEPKSEPKPEPKPEPKQKTKPEPKQKTKQKITVKQKFVVCDYCGAKHSIKDKRCSNCNAVLPLPKE